MQKAALITPQRRRAGKDLEFSRNSRLETSKPVITTHQVCEPNWAEARAMVSTRNRFFTTASLLFLVFSGVLAAEKLPERISDEAFWQMVSDFSEPGGFFRYFVSNESSFQYVIPKLKDETKPGGVYLGVGPDQNFTYVVALQPKIAFIVDIRRQNMLQHLMYKALIELSTDRAEFLSLLFSRERPADLNESSSPEDLFGAYGAVTADAELRQQNLAKIKDRLMKHHGFKLTSEDLKTIEFVFGAFYAVGPRLTYSGAGRGMPT